MGQTSWAIYEVIKNPTVPWAKFNYECLFFLGVGGVGGISSRNTSYPSHNPLKVRVKVKVRVRVKARVRIRIRVRIKARP